jgi:hypothetical protein
MPSSPMSSITGLVPMIVSALSESVTPSRISAPRANATKMDG